MSMSIRARMLLTTNLLVVGVGVSVGWLAIAVAGGDIQRALLDEPLAQAARLFDEGDLPQTDAALLGRMGRILGAEMATGDPSGRGIEASSLAADRQTMLARQMLGLPAPTRVTLEGRTYLVASTLLAARPNQPSQEGLRLYLLVPEERIAGAKQRAERNIALTTLAAVGVATLAAVWLSHTITRPLRRLAQRMDRLSRAATDVDLDALLTSERTADDGARSERRGPAEVARLTACYDHLLAQLAAARATLARSARMATLGQLSASIAHELRNPLSGIKMNARVLADEMARAGLDDESMTLIVGEVDRMDVYLQELLGLATGGGPPDGAAGTAPVRLDELAASVVSLLSPRCRHSGVTLECRFAEGLPAAPADPGRIRQVILNLALNALDATGRGGTITLSAEPAPGGAVRFAVSDTGGGVQVAPGTDIFEPFTSGKAGGTGLGLHVCRQIVGQHGGEIGYDSSPEGSTFWFTLPGGCP